MVSVLTKLFDRPLLHIFPHFCWPLLPRRRRRSSTLSVSRFVMWPIHE